MKFFLIVLAMCNEPVPGALTCEAAGEAATVYEYTRLSRCVQDREWFRVSENVEAYCTGQAPTLPPHAERG